MRFATKHLMAITTVFAVVLAATVFVKSVVAPRFVASVDHPNGSRLRVVQTFGDDLFNTSIYFDDGDGRWRWYYFDHDDWYWGSADSQQVLGAKVEIRSANREILFDVETGECTIHGQEVRDRTTPKSTLFRALPQPLADADVEQRIHKD